MDEIIYILCTTIQFLCRELRMAQGGGAWVWLVWAINFLSKFVKTIRLGPIQKARTVELFYAEEALRYENISLVQNE